MAGSVRGLVLDIDVKDKSQVVGNFLRLPAAIKADVDIAVRAFGSREIEVLSVTSRERTQDKRHARWAKGAKRPTYARKSSWLENSYRFDTQRFAAEGREMSLTFYSASPHFKFAEAGRQGFRVQLRQGPDLAFRGAWALGWIRYGNSASQAIFTDSVGPAPARNIIAGSIPATNANLNQLEREIGDAIGRTWSATGAIKSSVFGSDVRGNEQGFPRQTISGF